MDITSCDEIWTAIEENLSLVETGTSSQGNTKLTDDIKSHKNELNNTLLKFTQLLDLLNLIVDKQEQLKFEYDKVSRLLSGAEKRRAATGKLAPETPEDYTTLLTQLSVYIIH